MSCSGRDGLLSLPAAGQGAAVATVPLLATVWTPLRERLAPRGGWSVVSVVEKHYTGDVSAAHRRAVTRIAERAG